MDFMLRDLDLGGVPAALLGLDGLVNKQVITLSILDPLLAAPPPEKPGEAALAYIEGQVLATMEQKRVGDTDQALTLLMSGFALLLVEGCREGLAFGVQGFATRGPEEPQNEVMQRGAKDGFTESFLTNIAVIRRRLKTTDLKFEKVEVGAQSHTPLALCYLQGVASPVILAQVKQRLAACDLQTVLGAGYFSGFLDRGRLFRGVGMTERPDVVCGEIEEGRIAILVEGTPSALLVPFLFVENFQTLDDYLARPFYGTFLRWLKYAAFFLSAFLPGLYVAIVTHHPEMLPEALLLKIAESESQTPFPIMAETLLLYFLYEVLREAGLRAPRSLSATVSIVGGLVVGDTAVAAGLVGAPSLLVVALTAIAGYAVPRLTSPWPFCGWAFSWPGIFWGCGAWSSASRCCSWICAAPAASASLLSPIAPFRGELAARDVLARADWRRLARRRATVQTMPGSREIGE